MNETCKILILWALSCLCACAPVETPRPSPDPSSQDWRTRFDFDGDGRLDRIISEFSGGAHCCYKVGAELTSNGRTILLPFEMDGGYVGGLNLTQPERFAIRERPGALPELVMEIATYNGNPSPIDHDWTERFGVRTHRVVVCFAGGKAIVRDAPSDAPCHPPR